MDDYQDNFNKMLLEERFKTEQKNVFKKNLF